MSRIVIFLFIISSRYDKAVARCLIICTRESYRVLILTLQRGRISSVGMQRGQDTGCDGAGNHSSRRHEASHVLRIILFSCRVKPSSGSVFISVKKRLYIITTSWHGCEKKPHRAAGIVAARCVTNALTVRAIQLINFFRVPSCPFSFSSFFFPVFHIPFFFLYRKSIRQLFFFCMRGTVCFIYICTEEVNFRLILRTCRISFYERCF